MAPRKRTGRSRRRQKRNYTTKITRNQNYRLGMKRTVMVPYRCGTFNCYGLPSCLNTKLRYVDYRVLAPTNTTSDYWQYRLNDLYDPNYTSLGVNAQPYGRDQIVAMGWSRYQVMSAKVVVTFGVAGTGEPAICTIRPSLATTTPASVEAEMERQYSRSGLVTPGKPLILKAYYKMSQIFGKSNVQYITDNAFIPQVGASPDSPVYLDISARDLITNQTSGVGFCIRITFYCRWTEMGDASPS